MLNNTKIIVTFGPSCNKNILSEMCKSRTEIIRLNFSHGTLFSHKENIKLIRNLNEDRNCNFKIMQDLEGYRIRIGKMKEPISLSKGMNFYLTQEDRIDTKKEVPFSYKGSTEVFEENSKVFINDGKIILEIKLVEKNRIKVEVTNGGILKSNKGINIPKAKIEFPSLTKKDKKDVNVAIENKLDYIALSFVRSADDLLAVKEIVEPEHSDCKFIAKIENQQAVDNIEEIIEIADGIMIARGDLGVCVPIYKVPVLQKQIINKTHSMNKFAIVATQMLDSMTEEDIPTRAEVTDVANAVLDKTDYLLLSQETAVGNHPLTVVEMMEKIISTSEEYRSKSC